MVTRYSIRKRNEEKFKKCIELRKQGLSYSEIRKEVFIAKSTLQNWLVLAGLTLTQEHLQIQLKKRLEKKQIAVEASKITRAKNAEREISKFVQEYKQFLNDPLFVSGVVLYEAEGSKSDCKLSNSDYRVILMFITFLEKYFRLDRLKNMHFRVYIHETRSRDLKKIMSFWSKKLHIAETSIALSWKRNIVAHRKTNNDYVGQISVLMTGIPFLTRKLLFMSSIILTRYCRVV